VYALALSIRPTSALTFRILPGSILDIATYPFVPPTTLSGWLRRLWILNETGEVPGLKEGNSPSYYVLPRRYIPLGAYPAGEYRIHRTFRHGPRAFSHQEFSRLRRAGKGPKNSDLQLHTWEYLVAERFLGALLAPREEDLQPIQKMVGLGFKLGKEGFAYLEAVEGPVGVEPEAIEGRPLGLLEPSAWEGAVAGAYQIYRFAWDEGADPEPGSLAPSPVRGYQGAYLVQPSGEGRVKGFRLGEALWPWNLVEWWQDA